MNPLERGGDGLEKDVIQSETFQNSHPKRHFRISIPCILPGLLHPMPQLSPPLLSLVSLAYGTLQNETKRNGTLRNGILRNCNLRNYEEGGCGGFLTATRLQHTGPISKLSMGNYY